MTYNKKGNYSDTTVIIPTLNEGKNIGVLVKSIFSAYPGIRVIVSDDGSSDNTRQIAKSIPGVRLIDRRNEKVNGLTASLIDGIKAAETEYAIIIDGDLQHPPEKIGEIREKLSSNDIVGAARKKVLVKWPLHRKMISLIATLLAKARLMKNIPDPLTGFFGVRRGLFLHVLRSNEIKFEKQGYKIFFDLLKYAPKTSKIASVEYDFGLRQKGESKIKPKHIILFFRSIFK